MTTKRRNGDPCSVRTEEPHLSAAPHPARPESYPRRVLLCGAGLSPPVVTETLYALTVQRQSRLREHLQQVHDKSRETAWLRGLGDALPPAEAREDLAEGEPSRPFVPTEIHVITTLKGANAVVDSLLDPVNGWFYRFMRDYPQPQAIAFDRGHVHVIAHNGREVSDIETPEDSLAAGMTIVSMVQQFTDDPDCAVHASIAGGRRQMSYLLGMTLSLLGRQQDRLSHVLVNEAYETRGFFYPTPYEHIVEHPRHGTRDAREARLVLADMPLLRVFDGLGQTLSSKRHNFVEVVAIGQRAIQRPQIQVLTTRQVVKIGHIECHLAPREFFFYTVLALRRADSVVEEGIDVAKAGAVVVDAHRIVGFDGLHFARAASRLADLEFVPGIRGLGPFVSKLNSRLRDTFGKQLAERALVVGPGGSKDGHYGLLNAEPADLLVV